MTDSNTAEKGSPPETARRRRTPRWLVVVAAVVVVLVLGGWATLKVLFPPAKLRAMVEPRLEAQLGRDVELRSVSLRVFPRIAVRLEDLAIANAPGFSSEPAARLQALELQVRFWPLLRKQLELQQVRLLRPQIRYEVAADGTSNFAGMGAKRGELVPADTTAAETGGAAAPALLVSDMVLRDGWLFYTDAQSGRAARMALQGEVGAERAAEGGRAMEGRGTIDVSSIVALIPNLGADSIAFPDVKIDFAVLADLSGDSAVVRELEVRLGDLPLTGSGALRGLRANRRIDFSLESGDVDVARLLASLPPALRREGLDASGTARLSLKAVGPLAEGAKPPLNGSIDVRNVAASYGTYGRLLSGGAGQITFDTSSLSLPSFKADLLGRPFELQLNVPKYDTLVVNGRVSGGADLAKLAELRGEPLPAQGEVSVNLNFSGPVKELAAMRITGPVQLSNISYRAAFLKVPARIQTATLRLTGTGVSAERIPVALGNSDVTLSFSSQRLLTYMLSGERKGAIPAVEFTARSRRLDLPEVWADTAKYGYGQLMSARLAGRKLEGRDPTEIAKQRYKIAGLPPLQATGNVEVGQFINPPTEGRDVRFDVTLRDGLLELKNFGGRLYGGQLSGGLTLDLSKAQAPYPLRYEFRLQEAEGNALVSRWTRLGSAVSGKLDFNIAGNANLDEGFLPLTNAVEAAGRSAFREGKFDNFGPMVALVNKLRLEDRVATQFRELGGNFEVKGGAFHLKNWAYSAGDLKADISGSAGLGGALDLKLAMEVPPAVLEKAGLLAGGGGPLDGLLNQLKRDDKPVPLAVGLGGTVSQPTLKLDTDALQKTLEQRLQGTGKDLLKRLIKPPN